MTEEELDLMGWQDDGHMLNTQLNLFNGRDRNYGQIHVIITCPEDSSCHKWAKTHAHDYLCMVALEVENMGGLDFLDGNFNTDSLPDDWSSGDGPFQIEWRDMGEDGIEWRPRMTEPPTEVPAEESSGSLSRLADAVGYDEKAGD